MNEQLNAFLQQQLRDVHTPDAVSWWPLSLGWWLVLLIVLSVIVFFGYKAFKNVKANRYRQTALTEMEQHFQQWQSDADTSRYLQAVNGLLRRTIRHISQGKDYWAESSFDVTENAVAGEGLIDKWSNELNDYSETELQINTLQALTVDCYQANPVVEVSEIHSDLKAWLSSHRRPNDA